MESIVEFFAGIAAVGVYGTEGKPRHPIWRNALRSFVFLGSIFAFYQMLRFNQWPDVHITISTAWAFGLFIVASAECYVGRPWLSWAAVLAGAILLLQGLEMEGMI